jgi:hypothetical protein
MILPRVGWSTKTNRISESQYLALSLSSAASYDAILGAGAKSLEIVDEMTLLNMELFKLESSHKATSADFRDKAQESKEQAEVKLKEWANKAASSGINMLKKFSHRLLGCRTAILAYYDNRLSTGPVEAFNNKIKTIQRQAYGYRDQEFYRLKVYANHESRYELVG